MDERQRWKIIASNLGALVAFMVTVPAGACADVYCDPAGKTLSFGKPEGAANVKLCGVVAPNLADHYGLRPSGDGLVNDDGESVSKDRLAAYLTDYIDGAKDGGAEWGWEFKPPAD